MQARFCFHVTNDWPGMIKLHVHSTQGGNQSKHMNTNNHHVSSR
jgi:hypothetical protein